MGDNRCNVGRATCPVCRRSVGIVVGTLWSETTPARPLADAPPALRTHRGNDRRPCAGSRLRVDGERHD